MSLKTLCVYQIPAEAIPEPREITRAGREYKARECKHQETKFWGYKPFENKRGTDEEFVTPLHNGRWLYLRISLFKRILPSAVINQETERKAKKLEKQRNEPLTKKEKRELKEEVRVQLLQKAFQREVVYQVILDRENEQLWMDATSESLENDILRLLRRSLGNMPVVPLFETANLPTLFAGWVAGSLDLPKGLRIGDKAKAIDPDDPQATVTLSHEALLEPDIQTVLESRMLKLLGLENDHVACALTDEGQLKSVVINVNTEDDEADPDHMLTLWCMEMTRFIDALASVIGSDAPAPSLEFEGDEEADTDTQNEDDASEGDADTEHDD